MTGRFYHPYLPTQGNLEFRSNSGSRYEYMPTQKKKIYLVVLIAITIGAFFLITNRTPRVSEHAKKVIHEQNQNPNYRVTRKNLESLKKQNLITEKEFKSLLVFTE
jgi:hypothetical protein